MKYINPQHVQELDDRVSTFESVLEGREAFYISGSVTSGKDYLNWYKKKGKAIKNDKKTFELNRFNDITINNIAKIKQIASKLREIEKTIIIEPATFKMPNWSQDDYLYYWGSIISKYVKKIIFIDGWHYSVGCIYEYYLGLENDIELVDQKKLQIQVDKAIKLIKEALSEYSKYGIEIDFPSKILNEIENKNWNHSSDYYSSNFSNADQLKDEVLDNISKTDNVAQFVSFAPVDLAFRFSRIYGLEPNYQLPSIDETLQVLISNSQEKSINIRTFKPGLLKGNPFYYQINNVSEAINILNKSSNEGFYTIVNETIDIKDGGVSGVALDGVIEFSPNDTPKCVEKEGVCSLPLDVGVNILNKVYGFKPKLEFSHNQRVEFSIHPKRRGFLNEHTIIWEVENVLESQSEFYINWPNNFSRFIGDKAFGLLIAEEFNNDVPKSIVLSRNVAPFIFGRDTGLKEIWFRTCPSEKTPGKYPTFFGWRDPFKVLNNEDILENVVSIISQSAIEPIYSGAVLPSKVDLIIEGVRGSGDIFMLGGAPEKEIPKWLKKMIRKVYDSISGSLGTVTFEWVYDGTFLWIVQLSLSTIVSGTRTIFPGEVNHYIKFTVSNNLEESIERLRDLVKNIKPGIGIEMIGNIGITSHLGDILRKACVPSKLKVIKESKHSSLEPTLF